MFSRLISRAAAHSLVCLSIPGRSFSSKCSKEKGTRNHKVVIVGGGTAGLGVAAMLCNEGMKDVTIIEPSSKHYYQPLWTLVGAGIRSNEDSVQNLQDLIPRGVEWIQEGVATFHPESNKVVLRDGTEVEYDYLVVAAGIQIDWDAIPGLVEGLKTPNSGVVSVYDYSYSSDTWTTFKQVKASARRMLFTMPAGLIKCAGAAQKIMWLLEDTLRQEGWRHRVSVEFWVPGTAMFGVKRYADQLEAVRRDRGVEVAFKQELIAIDVQRKVATFKYVNGSDTTLSEQTYDLLHVTPPMSAPDFIKSSPLASSDGWMQVNPSTLQSSKYRNIFGLGDCTNTPNSKTAAAITAQAPVLVHNLREAIEGISLSGHYQGYSSCPLIVKKNFVILAEFGYDGKIMESFAPETGKFPMGLIGQDGPLQHRFFYWLTTTLFPYVYWNMWVRGKWYGRNGPFKPDVVTQR